MSFADEENELDGDCKDEEENLQWSPFKEYNRPRALGTSIDQNIVKSFIEDAFPDQNGKNKIQCKNLIVPLQETVQDLTSLLCNSEPCASKNGSISANSMVASERCECCMKREVVYTWRTLLRSFFQKKLNTKVDDLSWRRNFFDVLSLHAVQKGGGSLPTSRVESVLDVLHYQNKDQNAKPDPIYSSFGKLRNGFYVSSNGLVFSSETELKKFNAKMAEMDEKLKSELSVIHHQHNEMKAKAEERKLLSQRTESHEESDHDEEPAGENQQLNKESKPKDKAERKSGLFASLTASLSAARSGIQGFLEKSASPKEPRRSPQQQVPTDDNDDSEEETGKLTHKVSEVPTVDGIDNHDEFTRKMQAKGGLMYESTDKTVQHLSHDALPPPLSLQTLQAGSQTRE